MKKGIRHKLVPRIANRKNIARETKIIVLSDEQYEVPVDLVSALSTVSLPWDQRFPLILSHSQDLTMQYLKLINMLEVEVRSGIEESLKTKIIRISREVIGRTTDQVHSRYARKRIIGRLLSLLVNFDPIQELLSGENVVGLTISDKEYLRVHYANGLMQTFNWFVSSEEAGLLKLILARRCEIGQFNLKLSQNIVATISSLRTENLSQGSIFITPKRSKKKSMLDLIRAKVISPQLARNISKSIISSGQGFLISGGLDSGKSGLMSALVSSLSPNFVPLIIANDPDLGDCHPHAEILSHNEINQLLEGSSYRKFEDNIFRMGARHVFVDDLNPKLYMFLLRLKLVYDVPIIATIPSINPKQFLKYLIEDVHSLMRLHRDIDESEILQLVDAFPFVISLSGDKESKGVSCIYEVNSSGKLLNLVPVVRRCFENDAVSWKITDVASSETLLSIGYGI